MKRNILAFAILCALAGAAHAFGLGLGDRFGKLGAGGGTVSVAPPPTCSPGSAMGQTDLSLCSNASYAATIF